jgi:putative mRNA 3-end processing factor
MAALLELTDAGLYCARGDFFVDPWQPVGRAVVTHAHGDHARPGSRAYLCAASGRDLLARRVGLDARIQTAGFGQRIRINEVTVSLHPAGHILGSAQVRVEGPDGVWVVSGDYKREPDRTAEPFEVLRCDTFITEATFGLPLYHWLPSDAVADEIAAWWNKNAVDGRASILYVYALGKAQRVLALLAARRPGPVYVHGRIEPFNALYRAQGVELGATALVAETGRGKNWAGALVLAPGSAHVPGWLRRFGDAETAFASGWMRLRGTRRRQGFDRGFALSDHVDWPELLATIAETGAERVLATHGETSVLVRYLREEKGLDAHALATAFVGETEE